MAPAAIAQQELAAKFRGLTQAVLTYASTDNIAGSPSQDNTGHSFQATCMAAKTRQPQMQPDDIKRWAVQFEAIIQKHFLMGSPRVDLLLTLVQFNVFRALISNTQSLGWDFEWLECGEPSSPWVMECQDVPYACPLSLRPTSIQRKIDHHPWIDLWPIPKMRDNLLLAAGLYDEDELCNALVEFKDVPNEQSGLVVWGEPWDPASWEVSETFAQNWAWTIQGCTELMGSTNRWRSQRGDKPIVTWTADISKSPVGDGESL